MGPFTQEDPIGLAGGLNLYGYANGDPVNFSDPFGLSVCCRQQLDQYISNKVNGVLGAVRSIYDNTLGRLGFTVGGTLGSATASASAGLFGRDAEGALGLNLNPLAPEASVSAGVQIRLMSAPPGSVSGSVSLDVPIIPLGGVSLGLARDGNSVVPTSIEIHGGFGVASPAGAFNVNVDVVKSSNECTDEKCGDGGGVDG